MIFNASGGAYKDKEAALNKIKKLGSQNHCLLRYELVNEYWNLNFKTKGVRKVADSISVSYTHLKQKLDVKRDIYKKNRLILELFKDDISKFKDKNFPNEIKAIKNTPYQYRRISYEVLKDYCNGKYRKEKKHETKRVSKTIRTSV